MAQKETWRYQNVPLLSGQRVLYSSGMIVPSGESHFFDFRQQGKDISSLKNGEPAPSGSDGFPSANVPLYRGCTHREHGLILHFGESGTFYTEMSHLKKPVSSGIQDSLLAPDKLVTPFSEQGSRTTQGIPLE